MHIPKLIGDIAFTPRDAGPKRFGYLDQLRAIACLSVALCHLNPAMLPGGGIGVGIFFALSGYLISTTCLREVRDVKSALGFIIRRIFRVYPLMLVDLVVLWIAYAFFYTDLHRNFLSALPDLLLMKNMPSPFIGIGIGVLWTLQVEFAFYLLTPVFLLVFRGKLGLWILSIGLLLTSTGIIRIIPGTIGKAIGDVIDNVPILSWGGALALGVLVALVRETLVFGALGNRPRFRPLSYVATGLGLTGSGILFVLPPTTDLVWRWQILLASLASSALIFGWLLRPALLVIPGLPFIGRISFSIYLIHAVSADFAHYLNQTIGFSNVFSNPFVFIPIVIAMSYASYLLVEQPGIRAGAYLTKRFSKARVRGSELISGLHVPLRSRDITGPQANEANEIDTIGSAS